MRRLVGLISTDAIHFDRHPMSAPRNGPSLSSTHADGLGAAVYDDRANEWIVDERARAATPSDDAAALKVPVRYGAVLIAQGGGPTLGGASRHDRKVSRRGKWAFAHEGTIHDVDQLRRGASGDRLRECARATGSELLFAYLLSQLDRAGVSEGAAAADLDAAVTDVVGGLDLPRVGTSNFLLSDGVVLYAGRFGSALYFVERHGRPGLVAIASEPLIGQGWLALGDGALLRCKRSASLDIVFLRGSDPRRAAEVSDIELPFTD